MVIYGNNRTSLGSLYESGYDDYDYDYCNESSYSQIISECQQNEMDTFDTLVEMDFLEFSANQGNISLYEANIILESEKESLIKRFLAFLKKTKDKIVAWFKGQIDKIKKFLKIDFAGFRSKYFDNFKKNDLSEFKIEKFYRNAIMGGGEFNKSTNRRVYDFSGFDKVVDDIFADAANVKEMGREKDEYSVASILKVATGIDGNVEKELKDAIFGEPEEKVGLNSTEKNAIIDAFESENKLKNIMNLRDQACKNIEDVKKEVSKLKSSDKEVSKKIKILTTGVNNYTAAVLKYGKIISNLVVSIHNEAKKIIKMGALIKDAAKLEEPKLKGVKQQRMDSSTYRYLNGGHNDPDFNESFVDNTLLGQAIAESVDFDAYLFFETFY